MKGFLQLFIDIAPEAAKALRKEGSVKNVQLAERLSRMAENARLMLKGGGLK